MKRENVLPVILFLLGIIQALAGAAILDIRSRVMRLENWTYALKSGKEVRAGAYSPYIGRSVLYSAHGLKKRYARDF